MEKDRRLRGYFDFTYTLQAAVNKS